MPQNKIVRTFSHQQLMENMFDSKNGFQLIYDNIVDQTMCNTTHEVVFQYEYKFYKTNYAIGFTESGAYGPWKSENEITCEELNPVEKRLLPMSRLNRKKLFNY